MGEVRPEVGIEKLTGGACGHDNLMPEQMLQMPVNIEPSFV
jgi:hypothetical protein